VVGGLVVDMRRRGNRVNLVLDDRSGRMEVTMFDETFQACRHLVAKDAILLVEGGLRFDDFLDAWRVTARRVIDLDRAMEERARCLLIRCERPADEAFVTGLRKVLEPSLSGRCTVSLLYRREDACARIQLGERWRVRPSLALLHRLGGLVGADNVRMEYGSPPEP
jgi:DNA polymerase-3 subunit alpha